jgi:acetyl-CoA C-acetyltransferase
MVNDADPIVIAGAARTPMEGSQSALSNGSALEFGSAAIREPLVRSDIRADTIAEMLKGRMLPAHLGPPPARQIAMEKWLPNSVPCITLNKVFEVMDEGDARG